MTAYGTARAHAARMNAAAYAATQRASVAYSAEDSAFSYRLAAAAYDRASRAYAAAAPKARQHAARQECEITAYTLACKAAERRETADRFEAQYRGKGNGAENRYAAAAVAATGFASATAALDAYHGAVADYATRTANYGTYATLDRLAVEYAAAARRRAYAADRYTG